jgi:sugar lactone lactonase YvrE
MEWGDQTLYRVLNQALRSEDRQKLKIWFPYLKLFDTALEKLPTVKEVVWRGVPLDIGRNFTENKLVTWWSINSCSSSVNVIKSFIGNEKDSTLFLIEAINGKKISGYTEYENENEIILKMGTQFRVKCDPLMQSNGSHIVHLIQINDDDDEQEEENNLTPVTNDISVIVKPSNQGASSGKSFKTKWKQNGITVAGGNGQGSQLNEFHWPKNIHVDDDNQCMYIVDWGNDRIFEWKFGAKNGKVVAGGNDRGNRTDQLNQPMDVILDKENDSFIISDWGNRRVLRWPRRNAKNGQIIISHIDCSRLAIDSNGDLYISDSDKNEIKRWKIGQKNGTIVAGGNGEGDHLNQLNHPTYIFVDEDHSVYVSDNENHRVMKWIKDAKEGIVVAGGNGQGNNLTQLAHPMGIIVDQMGNIYVADSQNNRIMCWSPGSSEGFIVVGGNGKGQKPNQFHCPVGLSFDRQGNLYVVESNNSRVQKFDIDLN